MENVFLSAELQLLSQNIIIVWKHRGQENRALSKLVFNE